jgi:hypothetical protein
MADRILQGFERVHRNVESVHATIVHYNTCATYSAGEHRFAATVAEDFSQVEPDRFAVGRQDLSTDLLESRKLVHWVRQL